MKSSDLLAIVAAILYERKADIPDNLCTCGTCQAVPVSSNQPTARELAAQDAVKRAADIIALCPDSSKDRG